MGMIYIYVNELSFQRIDFLGMKLITANIRFLYVTAYTKIELTIVKLFSSDKSHE